MVVSWSFACQTGTGGASSSRPSCSGPLPRGRLAFPGLAGKHAAGGRGARAGRGALSTLTAPSWLRPTARLPGLSGWVFPPPVSGRARQARLLSAGVAVAPPAGPGRVALSRWAGGRPASLLQQPPRGEEAGPAAAGAQAGSGAPALRTAPLVPRVGTEAGAGWNENELRGLLSCPVYLSLSFPIQNLGWGTR